MFRIGKSIETESRLVIARGLEKGTGEELIVSIRCLWGVMKYSKIDVFTILGLKEKQMDSMF